MWEREEEYKLELEQVIQKAGTSRLERLAFLALEDERTCYKHVVVNLEKQYRKCGPNMRGKLHLLYCVSTLLRQSRKQQGARDRYAERLQPLTSALVADLRLDFSVQLDKLLKLWRMEGVFSAEQLMEVESGRAALALRQSGLQSKSPSGSLTEASAQDPHMGLGDASGSGRSSAIQSYPRGMGGRTPAVVPGTLPPYQLPLLPEGQDPYSADSNPNGMRGAQQPQQQATIAPPPPPSLIPPGLLGPVGPPGMLPQASAAAAAAAAGLFPQGQIGGFLGSATAALMQQAPFMAPMGHFGSASMNNGIPGGITPGMGVGVASHLGGGMGGAMPYPGPPAPMPPGLVLERPPPYPQPPIYNSQSQGQNHGARGMNYGRYNQTNGRIPPGLGPSTGPRSATAHGHALGWQGRYGQDGQGAVSQPLPPPPPRPPPGSPPHGADSRGSGTAVAGVGAAATGAGGRHRGSGVMDSDALVPPGIEQGTVSNRGAGSGGGSTSSANGATATGYIRPNGRRSRWELERCSGDASASAAPAMWAGGLPAHGTGPVPKRPALAVESGGSAEIHAPDTAAVKPLLPGNSPLLPTLAKVAANVPLEPGAATIPGIVGSVELAANALSPTRTASAEGVQEQQSVVQAQRSVEQQTCSLAMPDTSSTFMATEGQASGHGAEDVAVADGKADPDGATDQTDERIGVGIEIISSRQQEEQEGLLAAGKAEVGLVDLMMRSRALKAPGQVVEVDDGGSSSAEAVCPAAQHQHSTAPTSPGRPTGAAEHGESRSVDATDSHQGQRNSRQDEQRQRRSSSSGAGDWNYDRLSVTVVSDGQVADGTQGGRQQHAMETVKAAEAVMSTNQPSPVEQWDLQQRSGNDVQSAEHPSTQQRTEVLPDADPAMQPMQQHAGLDQDSILLDMAQDAVVASLGGQLAEVVSTTPSNATAIAVTGASDSTELLGSQQQPLQRTASDGGAPSDAIIAVRAPELVTSALEIAAESLQPSAASEPAALVSVPVAPAIVKAVETQPSAPAPSPQKLPQQQAFLHSSSLLLSSYDDSRVPLQLEELELGDLDESWLE
ncbi:hypothetical protein Vretimale_4438 [Volvox reticuliferus]|uniref:CID domain-containing protein n=1 Tax=Volvox reticuliferus TaxID=1737510 RepID=A0A8J4DGL8_9CHLO|nr:hypothetical protein Vretimale_4438 [Volvox reticuliferus]